MAKKVVYLSGPMTGIENYNYPMFNEVAREVRELGHRVINPAEFYGGHGDRTRQEYMHKSVQALLNSTNVILLPGWRDSKGCTLEVAIAQEIGLVIQEYVTEEMVEAKRRELIAEQEDAALDAQEAETADLESLDEIKEDAEQPA